MKLSEAVRKLRIFRTFLILAITFLCCGLLSFAGRFLLLENAFLDRISISSATDDETKLTAFHEAIRLKPSDSRPYLLILDMYAEDGIYTKKESEAFLATYNAGSRQLNQNSDTYPELLGKIGLLYINGYVDATTTRLRMALPFLKEAQPLLPENAENKVAVECYCRIGQYYADYIWTTGSIKEVSIERMEALITDISTALPVFLADTSDDATYNRMGFFTAVCDLLYDQRDILAATISYDTVVAILDQIYAALPEMDTLQQVQTQERLKTLKANKETYYGMIQRAYERTEGDAT